MKKIRNYSKNTFENSRTKEDFRVILGDTAADGMAPSGILLHSMVLSVVKWYIWE